MWISERSEKPPKDPSQLDEQLLRDWVDRLAVPRNFWAEGRANRRIGDLIAALLDGWGYDVRIQGPYRNVAAVPKNRRAPHTFVGAHYDSVPRFPGADDNASGVAVLLYCAMRIAGGSSHVGFIAFNAEEDGLLGSRNFVEEALPRLSPKPELVHVLEMVGYRSRLRGSQRTPSSWLGSWLGCRVDTGDFIGVLSNRIANKAADAVLRTASARNPRCLALKQWYPIDQWLPDLRRSDHFPFWQAAIPSLLWSDTAEFRNPNYHRKTDTPESLDYAFMADVASLLLATLTAKTNV